jgi:hypothetical protein
MLPIMRAWWTMLVVMGGVYAPSAGASTIDTLAEAYNSLDYETCVAASDDALSAPGSRREREDTYRYRGLCLAALGDTEAAKEAFVNLLAVNRDATLPDGLSPRFTSSFLEAKGEWVDRPATGFEIEDDVLDGKTRILTLKVNDRTGLLSSLQWRDPDGELHDQLAVAERMELQVPNEVAVAVVGFDAAGGVIAELDLKPKTAEIDKQIVEEEAVAPAEAEESGSLLTSPWLWLGVSALGAAVVVAGAAGVGAGVFFYEPQQVSMSGRIRFADDAPAE